MTPSPPIRVCGACGHHNPDGVRFCESCSTYLVWTATETAANPVEPEPATTAPGLVTPAEPKARVAPAAQVVDEPTGPLVCGACGTRNEAGRTYCRRCATPLSDGGPRPSWWPRTVSRFRAWRYRRRNPTVAAGELDRHLQRDAPAKAGGGLLTRLRRLRFRTAAAIGTGVALLALVGPWGAPARDAFAGAFDRIRGKVDLEPVTLVAADASSAAPGHDPAAAIDRRTDTWWAEDAPGDGTGAALVVRLDEPGDVAKVGFTGGAGTEPDVHVTHPRPRRLRLDFDDGTSTEVELTDEAGFQQFDVDADDVTALTVTIVDVYPANEGGGTDCAIAEVELFRRQR